MSNFENYDFILPDGVVIENEKADKVYSQIDEMYNKVGISNQIINYLILVIFGNC